MNLLVCTITALATVLSLTCLAHAQDARAKPGPTAIVGMRAGPAALDGQAKTIDKAFFPFIDRFGQYLHRDWPGKTHAVKELQARIETEAADRKANPGPDGWDEYGGWRGGPKLAATGHFRVAKNNGRWWLVDPAGRLFWSHGVDCVNTWSGTTPITDREHYFAALPKDGAPAAQFYGKGSWAPHGYYQGKAYRTYNFRAANLAAKYGANWSEQFAVVAHARLRSWGLNTIGNWSDAGVYLRRKTPYTVGIHIAAPPIRGSEGYWGQFPDPFDPAFRTKLRARLAKDKGASAGDPWCIGYFIHNELGWGDQTSLALAALASPADQPAKKAFLAILRSKYTHIAKLNKAWDMDCPSWQALAVAPAQPDKKKAHDDLTAFYSTLAEAYFRICRDEVKRVAPTNLYLGCRFAWVNDLAARAAAKHCDVITYNRYTYSVADFRLPSGVDKPVLIGEFHFGALDRGMFHTGLKKAADQNDRAAKYRAYVHGALRNPNIVGTHWFQYGDQATTGRGDGENYQIGFIDICDTPYPETVDAVRKVGYDLYRYRTEGK